MPKFIYSFEGGRMPATEAEGQKSMEDWGNWMAGLGDALVDGGGPVGKSRTVSAGGVAEGGGTEPLMGYSVVQAENIDAAIALLKGCPHFDFDGSCEVAEILEM